MLSINELRSKNSNLNKSDLIKKFQDKLDCEWDRSRKLTENSNYEYGFRIYYLYDEIKDLIREKKDIINISFYSLYIERLDTNTSLHEDNYYNLKDIINLFSDIKNKLDKIESKSLTKEYNLKDDQVIINNSEIMEYDYVRTI
ncbi:hypothetical protein [Staphylococcus kloosii]|jgi:hypothetical protein|uniref:hypothetical protein n=1 Tax=Staphylococcus kloosii TaxID=29384 RepID=UPI0018A00907|nr:hypothetical protein [Staphylococcus kloosii]MBF7023652.1 hypothetical protein [Staphylococcus kloosii]